MKRKEQTLLKAIIAFRDARDWKQFHTPKNLAAAIAVESAELQERFLWQTDAEATEMLRNPERRAKVIEELADILIYAHLLADSLAVDSHEVMRKKLKHNAKKYPIKKSKGNHHKYSEFPD